MIGGKLEDVCFSFRMTSWDRADHQKTDSCGPNDMRTVPTSQSYDWQLAFQPDWHRVALKQHSSSCERKVVNVRTCQVYSGGHLWWILLLASLAINLIQFVLNVRHLYKLFVFVCMLYWDAPFISEASVCHQLDAHIIVRVKFPLPCEDVMEAQEWQACDGGYDFQTNHWRSPVF